MLYLSVATLYKDMYFHQSVKQVRYFNATSLALFPLYLSKDFIMQGVVYALGATKSSTE